MTSSQRKDKIEYAIQFMLHKGAWPNWEDEPLGCERLVVTDMDRKRAIYFRLNRYDKYIARLSPARGSVQIRKDTTYQELFREYADRCKLKVRLVDEITFPGSAEPDMQSYFPYILERYGSTITVADSPLQRAIWAGYAQEAGAGYAQEAGDG